MIRRNLNYLLLHMLLVAYQAEAMENDSGSVAESAELPRGCSVAKPTNSKVEAPRLILVPGGDSYFEYLDPPFVVERGSLRWDFPANGPVLTPAW